jgi:hypothetical protein
MKNSVASGLSRVLPLAVSGLVMLSAFLWGASAEAARSRILFDEYHGERNTISAERASTLDPEYAFLQLRVELEDWYSVERGLTRITTSVLESVGVLILAVPEQPFEAHEFAAIEDFVSRGGGLLLLGDAHPPQALNDVAGRFGFRFLPGALTSPISLSLWDAHRFLAGCTQELEEITKWAQPFCTSWASALESPANARRLVSTAATAWQDLDDNGRKDAGEKAGPFTVAAALEVGEGRVVAISDNAFQDNMAGTETGNRLLLDRCIAWLLQLPPPRLDSGALSAASDLAGMQIVGTLPIARAGDPRSWADLCEAFHIQFLDMAPARNCIGFFTDEARAVPWLQNLSIPAASYFSEDPQDLPWWSLRTRYYDFLPEDRLWRDPDGSPVHDPFESSAARTIDGKTMTSEGGTFVVMSESSPYWLGYQEESIDWALSVGMDAMYIDLPDRVPLRLGSDFGGWSTAAFRDYLAAHHTSELASWGIRDVASFDIREYLLAQWTPRAVGTYSWWDGAPVFVTDPADAPLSDPIVRAFHVFEYSAHIAYFKALASYAHDAGTARQRFVPYYGNLWIGPSQVLLQSANPTVLLGQAMDVIYIEHSPAIPPDTRVAPVVKIGLAMGDQQKPVWLEHLGWYGWEGEPALLPPDPMTGVLKLFIAETYAAGGVPALPLGGMPGLEGRGLALDPEGRPLSELVKVMDFVARGKRLLSDRHPCSEVALVYSVPSFLWHDFPLFGMTSEAEREVFAASAMALEEAHILYDVVILGHPQLWDDSRALGSLSKYSAVVLPAVSCITDSQIQSLSAFVRGGGVLVAVGSPDRDESYARRLDPVFSDLDSDPGKGALAVLDVQLAKASYVRIGRGQGELFPELVEPLKKVAKMVWTDASSTVGVNLFESPAALTLHLVNYDYSIATDSVKKATNLAFRIALADLDFAAPKGLTYYSPDLPSPRGLPFAVVDDTVEFTVPELEYWGIVEISR